MTTQAEHDGATESGSDDHFFAASLREFPWPWAAGAAVATFVVEYLLVAALFVLGPSSVDRSVPIIDSTMAVLIQYAHILFNAHFVWIVQAATVPNVQIPEPFSNDLWLALVSGGAATHPLVYFLLPVVSLVIAGAVFERHRDSPATGRFTEAGLVGAGFTVGYLAVGILGSVTFVQRVPINGSDGFLTQQPDLYFTAIMFLVFPMLFATLGAVLAYDRDQA
ncbi:hypothetical protein [Haloarcula halophila]|uniref:hypothetical protein n=1 Tax=Haloarcula TaxID=2237 RepID=UPI0023E3D9A4|nr:hypothetical protein [Halomicroarcula sp. DFY41]